MFNIYIKDFNRNGRIITAETLMQTIPAKDEGELRLISPIIKAEMGTVEGFDFSIESGTPFYDAFLQMKTFIRVVYDGTTIFYGRVLTIDNNSFRGTRKIRCEGPMSFLLDSPVEGVEEKKRSEISTLSYLQELINNHNSYINNEANKRFMLGEVPGNYSGWVSSAQRVKSETRPFGSDSWTDTKSALEDLRSHYGGFLRARPAGGIGGGIYLDWMNHYFNPNTINQKVEVGKNIIDISNVTEIDNVFTAIVPIGRHDITVSSEGTKQSTQSENLYVDGKVVRVPDVCSKYSYAELSEGYHRYEDYRDAISKYGMIIKQVSFPDASTKEKLYDEACEWIKNNYQGEVTKFTIKAIDMHQIGENVAKINVGDRVTIVYPVAKEDGTFPKYSTTQTCLAIQYDLYHPENNSYTFGIPANILTKTYGLRKQSKSVNNSGTSPVSRSGGGFGGNKDKDWLDVAANWLMHHKLHYNPPDKSAEYWPYTEKNSKYMSGGQLYSPATVKNLNPDLVRAYKGTPGGPNPWSAVIAEIPSGYTFDYPIIEKWNVCEYVYYEYGVDLRSGLGVDYPTITQDDEGNLTFWGKVYDAAAGIFRTVDQVFFNLGKVLTRQQIIGVYGPDGETLYSYIDPQGNYHYYYVNEAGEEVETNIRDLHIAELHDDKRIGWVVYEDEETGELSFRDPGQMALQIENYAQGELVVARVAGELTYLGNLSTQYLAQTSLNHMDSICGDFDYIRDPETGIRYVEIKSGGGFRVQHGVLDKDGNFKRDASGNILHGEYGLFDKNTLKGGMIVEKINDTEGDDGNPYDVKIVGDRVDIKATQMARIGIWTNDKFDAGVIIDRINEGKNADGKQVLGTRISLSADQVIAGNSYPNLKAWIEDQGEYIDETAGLLAEKITAYEGRFHTIETDYLKTNELSAGIAKIPTLNGIAAKFSGNVSAGGALIGSQIYVGSEAPYTNISDGIKEVQIDGPTGNVYTLQYKKFSDSTWQDGGTFSRAVSSWAMGWSGGKFTVKANPQNQSVNTQIVQGTTSWDGNTASINVDGIDSDNPNYQYYTGRSIVVDASGRYRAGYDYAISHRQSKTLTWSVNGTYTVGADSGYTGLSSVTVNVSVPTPSPSIDIPTSGIDTAYSDPGGTRLNNLASACKEAMNNKYWVKFVVNAGDSSKTYKMYFG